MNATLTIETPTCLQGGCPAEAEDLLPIVVAVVTPTGNEVRSKRVCGRHAAALFARLETGSLAS